MRGPTESGRLPATFTCVHTPSTGCCQHSPDDTVACERSSRQINREAIMWRQHYLTNGSCCSPSTPEKNRCLTGNQQLGVRKPCRTWGRWEHSTQGLLHTVSTPVSHRLAGGWASTAGLQLRGTGSRVLSNQWMGHTCFLTIFLKQTQQ